MFVDVWIHSVNCESIVVQLVLKLSLQVRELLLEKLDTIENNVLRLQ